VAAAGDPESPIGLLKGCKIGDRVYKNHLDGYNQMDLLLGKGPSARHELFYFGAPTSALFALMTSSISSTSSHSLARGEDRDRLGYGCAR